MTSAPPIPAHLVVHPGPRLETGLLPRVRVVVLNYNGRQHLSPFFSSLHGSEYPRERWSVVLVDNGSTDDSLSGVRKEFPWVRVEANPKNVGFSAGCNQGAALDVEGSDDPEVLVFLNNDMRVEPDFLAELVAPIVRGECAATTARMMSWDGKRINSAGGGMNFHGFGIQKGYDQKPGPEHDVPTKSLFACGGAMAIDARVFEDVGGFDEEFFAYYEDVDLGWRLWVLGHEVHYVPSAVCYHHHSSTSGSFPVEGVRLLQVRNPMLACFKNYEQPNLDRVFPAMMTLAWRRVLLYLGLDKDPSFRIENHRPGRTGRRGRIQEKLRRRVAGKVQVPRGAIADVLGINDLLADWDHWLDRRAEVQDRRRRPDSEILPLFHKPLWCIEDDEEGYANLHAGLVRMYGLDELFRDLTDEGPLPLH